MTTGPERLPRALDDALLLLAAASVAFVLAVSPSAAATLHGARITPVGPGAVTQGWWSIATENRWTDPASAFPRKIRRSMPGAPGWWAAVAYCTAVTALLLTGAGRRLDRRVTSPTLGRRWWAMRGARPRAWARPRDLGSLTVARRVPPEALEWRLNQIRHRGYAIDDERAGALRQVAGPVAAPGGEVLAAVTLTLGTARPDGHPAQVRAAAHAASAALAEGAERYPLRRAIVYRLLASYGLAPVDAYV